MEDSGIRPSHLLPHGQVAAPPPPARNATAFQAEEIDPIDAMVLAVVQCILAVVRVLVLVGWLLGKVSEALTWMIRLISTLLRRPAV